MHSGSILIDIDLILTERLVDTHGRHQAKERTQNTIRGPGFQSELRPPALLASGERQLPVGESSIKLTSYN